MRKRSAEDFKSSLSVYFRLAVKVSGRIHRCVASSVCVLTEKENVRRKNVHKYSRWLEFHAPTIITGRSHSFAHCYGFTLFRNICTDFLLYEICSSILVPLRHSFVCKMIYSVIAIKLSVKGSIYLFRISCDRVENRIFFLLKWYLHHFFHCFCRLACSFCVSIALCVCVGLGLYNVCAAHHCFRITDLKWCTNNLTIVFFFLVCVCFLLIFASIGIITIVTTL